MHSDKVSTTAVEPRSRKSTKPLMEKKRRARINASLAELKSLLLEVIKKEGARHSKMEKADILEMTVRHLRDMQRHSFTAAAANDPTISDKHRLGFSECTQEVSRYLRSIDGCDVELRTRLLDHLANFITGSEPKHSPSPPLASLPMKCSSTSPSLPVKSISQSSATTSNRQPQLPLSPPSNHFFTDINNNISTTPQAQTLQPANVVSGLQVIPTKLQTGEIAFVLPGNIHGSGHVPNYVIPVYTSSNTSPIKPTVTMTTGAATPGSYVTIVPSNDVFQTCVLAPGNVNIMSQPVSSETVSLASLSASLSSSTSSLSVSPSSTSDSSMLSLSPPLHPGNDVRDVREIRHRDVRDIGDLRHEQIVNTQMWRPW